MVSHLQVQRRPSFLEVVERRCTRLGRHSFPDGVGKQGWDPFLVARCGKHVFYLNTINLWQCKMAMANYPCVDGLCLRLDDQSCAWIFHGDKSHSGQCNLQETRTTILWRMFARISWCFHIHVYIYICTCTCTYTYTYICPGRTFAQSLYKWGFGCFAVKGFV